MFSFSLSFSLSTNTRYKKNQFISQKIHKQIINNNDKNHNIYKSETQKITKGLSIVKLKIDDIIRKGRLKEKKLFENRGDNRSVYFCKAYKID